MGYLDDITRSAGSREAAREQLKELLASYGFTLNSKQDEQILAANLWRFDQKKGELVKFESSDLDQILDKMLYSQEVFAVPGYGKKEVCALSASRREDGTYELQGLDQEATLFYKDVQDIQYAAKDKKVGPTVPGIFDRICDFFAGFVGKRDKICAEWDRYYTEQKLADLQSKMKKENFAPERIDYVEIFKENERRQKKIEANMKKFPPINEENFASKGRDKWKKSLMYGGFVLMNENTNSIDPSMDRFMCCKDGEGFFSGSKADLKKEGVRRVRADQYMAMRAATAFSVAADLAEEGINVTTDMVLKWVNDGSFKRRPENDAEEKLIARSNERLKGFNENRIDGVVYDKGLKMMELTYKSYPINTQNSVCIGQLLALASSESVIDMMNQSIDYAGKHYNDDWNAVSYKVSQDVLGVVDMQQFMQEFPKAQRAVCDVENFKRYPERMEDHMKTMITGMLVEKVIGEKKDMDMGEFCKAVKEQVKSIDMKAMVEKFKGNFDKGVGTLNATIEKSKKAILTGQPSATKSVTTIEKQKGLGMGRK